MATVDVRRVRADTVRSGEVVLDPAAGDFVGKRVLYREDLSGGEVRLHLVPLTGGARPWRSERKVRGDQLVWVGA